MGRYIQKSMLFNAIIHIEFKWEGIFKSLCLFNAIIHIEVGRCIQKSVLV